MERDVETVKRDFQLNLRILGLRFFLFPSEDVRD